MGNTEKNEKQRYLNKKRKKKEYFAFRIGMLSDFKHIKSEMRKRERRDNSERMHR